MSGPDRTTDAGDGPAPDNPYPVLASEPLYAGKVVSLRRDTLEMDDGRAAHREVVDHPGAVGVVAVDAEDRVVMVNQYRHPVGQRLDELPAGLLDVAGESALAAAQRELAEEAGLAADRWDVLIDLYTSPGFSTEAIRLFLARQLHEVGRPSDFRVEGEEVGMTVHRVPLEQAVRLVFAGEVTNAAAVAGITAAAAAHARGWAGLRSTDAPWPARPGR